MLRKHQGQEGLGSDTTSGFKTACCIKPERMKLSFSKNLPPPFPRRNHSKCLVHCKMGVSRSASTVIAYAMKEFGWPLEKAYNYVKQKRSITRPNAGFMRQLSEYEGILDARWVAGRGGWAGLGSRSRRLHLAVASTARTLTRGEGGRLEKNNYCLACDEWFPGGISSDFVGTLSCLAEGGSGA